MSQQIATRGESVLCEFPDGTKVLVGKIVIDCPICGAGEWRIAGHHMRTILRLLAQWIEEHPELTGPETPVSIEKTRLVGLPGNPQDN